MLTGDETGEDIFLKERKPRASSRSIIDWFLLALACLIPLDVGVRRVQLDWYVIRGWLGLDRKSTSEEMLGALLERKRAIEFVPGAARKRKRRVAAGPVRRGARPAAEKSAVEREPKPTEPEEKPGGDTRDVSTTGRLLRMKKKWKKKG